MAFLKYLFPLEQKKKTFKDKCRLAYIRVLEKRHDIKIRFKVLVDADIPELKESDMAYLDDKLGYNRHLKQGVCNLPSPYSVSFNRTNAQVA